MAKPDKTDKPEDARPDNAGKTDDIIDAEIVEETAAEIDAGAEPAGDEPAEALQLEEPSRDAAEDDAPEDSAGDAPNEPAPAEDQAAEDTAEDGEAPGASDAETAEAKDGEADAEAEETDPAKNPAKNPADPETTEPAVSAEAPPEKARGGFVPLVLGGVVAAALGFGAATYLQTEGILFGGGADEEIAALTEKLEAQSALMSQLQTAQQAIAGGAADQMAAAKGAVDDSNARMAALSQRVEELGGKLLTLEGRVIEAEKRPMSEGASSAAIEAYEKEVEKLRSLVAEQLAEAEQLKATSTRTAQETLAQAALTRVVSAVDAGVPYRAALTELASVSGVAIPAELSQNAETGVVTQAVLIDRYPDFARPALAEARKAEKSADAGVANRLELFFKSQLGARSTQPKEGEDADAILSRAEAALRENRLSAALDELAALPEGAQAAMGDWRQMAASRLAALSAVDALARTLNSK
ncbi:hypothetical protein [Shimia sp.]|uniref:hypothetical protein n=1 Tax=Shimia sp. TaxID=1954381 RepID=UPI003567843D